MLSYVDNRPDMTSKGNAILDAKLNGPLANLDTLFNFSPGLVGP